MLIKLAYFYHALQYFQMQPILLQVFLEWELADKNVGK